MKAWGATFLLIGLGSFVLPAIGMQFRLVSLFGDSHVLGGAICAGLGGLLMLAGLARDAAQME